MFHLPFTFLMNIYSIMFSAANPSVYQHCVPKQLRSHKFQDQFVALKSGILYNFPGDIP